MKKEMILVIDEQNMQRVALTRILENSYFVIDAKNARQALNSIKQNKDVISLIVLSDSVKTDDFGAIIKFVQSLENEIPICVSLVSNSSKGIETAKLYGIGNFVVRPYNANIVLKLFTQMLASQKKEEFMKNDFVREYNLMIQKNTDLEKSSVGSLRIDFEKQAITNESGIIRDIVAKESYMTYSKIIKELADMLIEEDKDAFEKKYAYGTLKTNFKKGSDSLDTHALFRIDGKVRNITLRILNISSMENGTDTALLVLLDEREEYVSQALETLLFKTHYDLIALIDVQNKRTNIRSYSYDLLKVNAGDMSYSDLMKKIGDKYFDNDREYFDEKTEFKEVIDQLTRNTSYDVLSFSNDNKMKSYQLSYRYLDKYKEQVVFVIEDVTTKREMDFITDALNYHGFLNRSQEIISRNKDTKFALVYCNCINYKDIVEYVSVDAIVSFLKTLFATIKDSFLSPEIIGRTSSDAFWLLVNADKVDLSRLTEFRTIQMKDQDRVYFLTFNFGVYTVEPTDRELRSFDIDSYCERAKIAEESIGDNPTGENYVIFNETLRNDFIVKSTILNDIKEALTNKEIDVHYQPIYDIKGDKIVAAEALIRWNHHHYGYISPGLFIPFIESNGTISEIDKFVIRHVRDFLDQEKKAGHYVVPISCNLSRLDFFDKELLDLIVDVSKDHNSATGFMNFEVTESYYIDLTNNMANVLNDLRRNNSKILLDDFGDGLSSFKALISSKFDIIKIYKGLVDQIETNPISAQAIKSIVSMCHSVGLQVIAEGVEKEAQLQFLKACKVDMIQGFIYGKPMSEREFIAELRKINK